MKHLLAALFALALIAPVATPAQDVPSYAQTATADEQIHGRILSFDGGYNLRVQDERGFVDNVTLHDGTIINPTGLSLAPGMVVSILGYNAGSALAANEVDTPYTIFGGVPYYQSHPWTYYGPTVGLAFFFGNAGWWHGDVLHPRVGIRVVAPVRVYNHVDVQHVYQVHAGNFQGRKYVASPQHGGYRPAPAGNRGGGGHGGSGHGH